MTNLQDFELLPGSVIRDAAFLVGLIAPHARSRLHAVPVQVDGWWSVALCIKARGSDGEIGLHPVCIVPHQRMKITDTRSGHSNTPTRIGKVEPIDRDHARLMLEAMAEPNEFFENMTE